MAIFILSGFNLFFGPQNWPMLSPKTWKTWHLVRTNWYALVSVRVARLHPVEEQEPSRFDPAPLVSFSRPIFESHIFHYEPKLIPQIILKMQKYSPYEWLTLALAVVTKKSGISSSVIDVMLGVDTSRIWYEEMLAVDASKIWYEYMLGNDARSVCYKYMVVVDARKRC